MGRSFLDVPLVESLIGWVGVPAEQLVHRCSKAFTDRVPYGDVHRSLGDVVVHGSVQNRVNLFPVQHLDPEQLWGENWSMIATMDCWVSP